MDGFEVPRPRWAVEEGGQRLPSQADALAVCGRGLHLVEHLAVEWGWRGEPGDPLTVWARIDPYAPVPDTVEA